MESENSKTPDQSLFSFTLNKLSESTVNVKPFEHVVVDEIFSPDLYRQIVERWPADTVFSSLSQSGSVSRGSYEARQFIDLVSQKDEVSDDPDTVEFWASVTGFLNGPFAQALLDLFKPHLVEFYGREIFSEKIGGRARLTVDVGPYSLGPHTDASSRILASLIYCPPKDDYRSQGTSLYLPKSGHHVTPGEKHHSFDDFESGGMIEFVPNRLMCFMRSESSWHGVEALDGDGGRRAINYKLFKMK